MSLSTAYSHFEEGKKTTLEWFRSETATLRTGRVKPDLLESISVEYYGARTPLKGVANIANTDARTLVISPWDAGATTAIKKAITEADIGVQPTDDGKVIRLSFPMQTEESREQTIKMLHKKAEEARIRFRQIRDEALSGLKTDKHNSDITEDDWYSGKEKLDEMIDGANDDIAEAVKKKEAEIKTI